MLNLRGKKSKALLGYEKKRKKKLKKKKNTTTEKRKREGGRKREETHGKLFNKILYIIIKSTVPNLGDR